MYWIDQALLINQVGSDDIKMFRDAYIKTASALFDIKGGGERKELKKIETSIAEASPEKSRKITLSMLENLVQALENGPNLGFIKAYWINAHRPEMLTKKRAELRA